MKKYTLFDDEIEEYSSPGEHAIALLYVIIVVLAVVAVALNFTGIIDTFINSFGN